jgi:transglutaminase-like putative cysteine protease
MLLTDVDGERGPPMPIIKIRHVTTYKYKQAVAFGAHRILEVGITITPEPTDLVWKRDQFGNHVAMARFDGRSQELRFESMTRLDQASAELRNADIADFARIFPFAYPAHLRWQLARFMAPRSLHPRLDRWARRFLRRDGTTQTRDLLTDLTRTIHTSFIHFARHERGTQDPLRTLTIGSGSCRDHAVFLIAALRSLGVAARFVSGYLEFSDDEEGEEAVGGNTHAWVQAYVPGPGWVDLDPSNGIVGNRRHVRVAVVAEPKEAVPLQGTWFGAQSDHLGMTVVVKVRSEPEQYMADPA